MSVSGTGSVMQIADLSGMVYPYNGAQLIADNIKSIRFIPNYVDPLPLVGNADDRD